MTAAAAAATAATSSTFFGIMIYEAGVLHSFELDGKRRLQTLYRVHKMISEEKHKFEKANMMFVKAL